MDPDFSKLLEQTLTGAASTEETLSPPLMELHWFEYNHVAEGSTVGVIIRFEAMTRDDACVRLKEILTTLRNDWEGCYPDELQTLVSTMPGVFVRVFFHPHNLSNDNLDANLYED